MTPITPIKKPLLRLRFEGPAIHDGRILYDDFSTFLSNIRLAIERIINGLRTGDSIKRGRPFKATQILAALEIVSTRKGSFQLALDLRRNGQPFPGWDMGEQAIDLLMQGLKAVESENQLPKECDQDVMIALREAGRIIDKGIDKVTIKSRSSFGMKKVLYTQPTRERIISYLRKYEQSYAIIEGRLLSVDAKEDKLRCRIEPSLGEPTLCKFDESLTEQILSLIRHFVQARGDAIYDVDTNKIASLYIRDIEPIDESIADGSTRIQLSSFWKGKTFEELAAEQAVYPIDDISNLSKDWPEDTDFDTFFDAVRSARS
jgi:hypothetical protein